MLAHAHWRKIMTMKRYLLLLVCIAVAGCFRSHFQHLADIKEDRSIVFPQFFERPAVDVTQPGQPYQLDGVTLRAIAIAANDFLSPGRPGLPCVDQQEAHFYRVIRQGQIIFIRIDENPEYCGRKYGRLDSGAKYAISTDGRILRRVLDGMDVYVEPADAGPAIPGEPGVSPTFDPDHLQYLPFMPSRLQDGGAAGPMADGGV
jgi:hypothetical protein